MDPFTGTWKADFARSQRDPNHQFQSATLRFAVYGDAVSLTHGGVNMSGKVESGTTNLLADGTPRAVSPAGGGWLRPTTAMPMTKRISAAAPIKASIQTLGPRFSR